MRFQVAVVVLLAMCGAQPSEGCARWLAWFGYERSPAPVSSTAHGPRFESDIKTQLDAKNLPSAQRKERQAAYYTPRPATMAERAAVIADWALATYHAVRLAQGFSENPEALGTAAILIPPTFYAADAFTHAIHKFWDSYASERNWIWGHMARDFRIHHEFLNNLNERDYCSNVTSGAVFALPFLTMVAVVPLSPEYSAALWLFFVATFNANEFHRQAHLKNPNWFFRALQKMRLAISRKEHLEHHGDLDGEFGILNGWSNWLPRKLDLWKRMDRIYYRLTKKFPHNWYQNPASIPKDILLELNDEISRIPEHAWQYAELHPERMPEMLIEAKQH